MINTLVIVLIVSMIAAIVYLSRASKDATVSRKKYLEEMTHHLGGQLSSSEQYENSYKIDFTFDGKNFSFEDIKDEGIRNSIYISGLLKTALPFNFTLNFLELQRVSLLAKSNTTEGVYVPKSLREFGIQTDHTLIANKLFTDAEVLKTFNKYKNMDSRGHPVMSLNFNGTHVFLTFHSPGEDLKPNLLDLSFNVSSIETHIKKLLLIIAKLESLKDEYKNSKDDNKSSP